MATLNIPQGTENFNLNKHLIENLQNMNSDLNNFNSSLNDMTKDYVATDSTYGNGVLSGKIYSVDYIRSRQDYLYANFYRKLRKGNAAIICNMGDSLTYGHDTVSADIRPADTTPLPDGSVHVQTRASVTFPEALSTYLNQVFNNNVTVINRGYSGDGTQRAYNHWITPSGADITTICLGVNDSRATGIPYYGNIDEFLKWYEMLIVREILRNSAVIILTPPKQRNEDLDVDTFANALYLLGQKYNCPVIDINEFVSNYDYSIYSDDTHFNGTGYTIIGAKLASIFIGEGCHKPRNVSGGSKLLTRKQIDNFKETGTTNFENVAGSFAPAEVTQNQSIIARLNAINDSLVYSIYVDTEDLVCIPTAYLGSGSIIDCEIDFGILQPDYSLDASIYKTMASYTEKPLGKITISASGGDYTNYSPNIKLSDISKYLHIATRGWHTIRIKLSTGSCIINGLEFIEYKALKLLSDTSSIATMNGRYVFQTNPAYNDTTVVSYTDINYDTLLAALNATNPNQFWRGLPIKLTVYNWNNSILEYMFTLGDKLTGLGFELGTSVNRFNIAGTPTERTVTSLSYTQGTNTLRINYGGATNRAATVMISI